MTISRTALGGLLALALAPALWTNDAAAHSCDDPFHPASSVEFEPPRIEDHAQGAEL